MMNQTKSANVSFGVSFTDEPEFPSVYQNRAGVRLPNGSRERLVYLVDPDLGSRYDKFVGACEDQSGVRAIIEQHRATLRQAEFLYGPAF